MYSTPEASDPTLRTGVASCPPGSYCQGGVKYLCPAGRFGASFNSSTLTCDGPCVRFCCGVPAWVGRRVWRVRRSPLCCAAVLVLRQMAGRYCPSSGGTSNVGLLCGNASLYCPEGAAYQQFVSPGYFSTGGPNSSLQSAQVGHSCGLSTRLSRCLSALPPPSPARPPFVCSFFATRASTAWRVCEPPAPRELLAAPRGRRRCATHRAP
jgi:hypothetical protein